MLCGLMLSSDSDSADNRDVVMPPVHLPMLNVRPTSMLVRRLRTQHPVHRHHERHETTVKSSEMTTVTSHLVNNVTSLVSDVTPIAQSFSRASRETPGLERFWQSDMDNSRGFVMLPSKFGSERFGWDLGSVSSSLRSPPRGDGFTSRFKGSPTGRPLLEPISGSPRLQRNDGTSMANVTPTKASEHHRQETNFTRLPSHREVLSIDKSPEISGRELNETLRPAERSHIVFEKGGVGNSKPILKSERTPNGRQETYQSGTSQYHQRTSEQAQQRYSYHGDSPSTQAALIPGTHTHHDLRLPHLIVPFCGGGRLSQRGTARSRGPLASRLVALPPLKKHGNNGRGKKQFSSPLKNKDISSRCVSGQNALKKPLKLPVACKKLIGFASILDSSIEAKEVKQSTLRSTFSNSSCQLGQANDTAIQRNKTSGSIVHPPRQNGIHGLKAYSFQRPGLLQLRFATKPVRMPPLSPRELASELASRCCRCWEAADVLKALERVPHKERQQCHQQLWLALETDLRRRLSQRPPTTHRHDSWEATSSRYEKIMSFITPRLRKYSGQLPAVEEPVGSWQHWRDRVQSWTSSWLSSQTSPDSDDPIQQMSRERPTSAATSIAFSESQGRGIPERSQTEVTNSLWHRFIGQRSAENSWEPNGLLAERQYRQGAKEAATVTGSNKHRHFKITQTSQDGRAISSNSDTKDPTELCETLKRDLIVSLSSLGDMLRRDNSSCSFYSMDSDSIAAAAVSSTTKAAVEVDEPEKPTPTTPAKMEEESAIQEAQAMIKAGVGRNSSSESAESRDATKNVTSQALSTKPQERSSLPEGGSSPVPRQWSSESADSSIGNSMSLPPTGKQSAESTDSSLRERAEKAIAACYSYESNLSLQTSMVSAVDRLDLEKLAPKKHVESRLSKSARLHRDVQADEKEANQASYSSSDESSSSELIKTARKAGDIIAVKVRASVSAESLKKWTTMQALHKNDVATAKIEQNVQLNETDEIKLHKVKDLGDGNPRNELDCGDTQPIIQKPLNVKYDADATNYCKFTKYELTTEVFPSPRNETIRRLDRHLELSTYTSHDYSQPPFGVNQLTCDSVGDDTLLLNSTADVGVGETGINNTVPSGDVRQATDQWSLDATIDPNRGSTGKESDDTRIDPGDPRHCRDEIEGRIQPATESTTDVLLDGEASVVSVRGKSDEAGDFVQEVSEYTENSIECDELVQRSVISGVDKVENWTVSCNIDVLPTEPPPSASSELPVIRPRHQSAPRNSMRPEPACRERQTVSVAAMCTNSASEMKRVPPTPPPRKWSVEDVSVTSDRTTVIHSRSEQWTGNANQWLNRVASNESALDGELLEDGVDISVLVDSEIGDDNVSQPPESISPRMSRIPQPVHKVSNIISPGRKIPVLNTTYTIESRAYPDGKSSPQNISPGRMSPVQSFASRSRLSIRSETSSLAASQASPRLLNREKLPPPSLPPDGRCTRMPTRSPTRTILPSKPTVASMLRSSSIRQNIAAAHAAAEQAQQPPLPPASPSPRREMTFRSRSSLGEAAVAGGSAVRTLRTPSMPRPPGRYSNIHAAGRAGRPPLRTPPATAPAVLGPPAQSASALGNGTHNNGIDRVDLRRASRQHQSDSSDEDPTDVALSNQTRAKMRLLSKRNEYRRELSLAEAEKQKRLSNGNVDTRLAAAKKTSHLSTAAPGRSFASPRRSPLPATTAAPLRRAVSHERPHPNAPGRATHVNQNATHTTNPSVQSKAASLQNLASSGNKSAAAISKSTTYGGDLSRRQATTSASSVFSDKLQGFSNPRSALDDAYKKLNSNDWEREVAGLTDLVRIFRFHPEAAAHDIKSVTAALMKQLKNLRSQVLRTALQASGEMFQHVGKHVEPSMDKIVNILLHKTSDTNKFIRADSNRALDMMLDKVSVPRSVSTVITEGVTHRNPQVRCTVARLLAEVVLHKLGPAASLSGQRDVTDRLVPAAAQLVREGDLNTRLHAKSIFQAWLQHPDLLEKNMNKHLSGTVKRDVERVLDNIRNEVASSSSLGAA